MLDARLPKIETGKVLLLAQMRREAEALPLRMAAAELAEGRPVHWVDGGSRFDPSHVANHVRWQGGDARAGLDLLQVCRGFTAHQVVAQVLRMANDPRALASSRLLIVSDLARMLADPQVGAGEGRSMMRRTMERLRQIAQAADVLVLVTDRTHAHPQSRADQMRELRMRIDVTLSTRPLHLHGRRRGIRGPRPLRLALDEPCISVDWHALPRQQASLLDFRRRAIH